MADTNTEIEAPKEPGAAVRMVSKLGDSMLTFVNGAGELAIFSGRAIAMAFQPPFRLRLLVEQLEFVGVGTMFIILLTGSFTGAVFTLQSVGALSNVGLENMVGSMVLLATSRELGPVLTSLMVTGRVSSAMATELGTMRVTEQIDAIEVMAVDPIQYLVVPRMLAALIMTPALTIIFDMVAAVGSYLVAVVGMGLDEGAFIARIELWLNPWDFTHGMFKSAVFGTMVALIGCYKGYKAGGGAKGVGIATTQAVVLGSILIFVFDYLLTAMLLPGAPENQMVPGATPQ